MWQSGAVQDADPAAEFHPAAALNAELAQDKGLPETLEQR
jgi:hypothetical protein